jgi:lysine 2,3-aminomutase
LLIRIIGVGIAGKRWVDQLDRYDRERGISYWSKNYRTSIEANDPSALARDFEFYDPISTLPLNGQRWWAQQQRKAE